MRKKKFFLLLIIALVVLTAFVTVFTSGEDESALPRCINIGTQEIPNEEMLAVARGYFEEELGIPCNIIEFQAGDIRNAMVSGDIDFAMLGSSNAILGACCGMDISLIWVHEILGDAEQLIVQRDRGINSIADLRGRKIAVPLTTTSHYALLKALEMEGLSERDVTVFDMQMPEIYVAFTKGNIDGAYVWEPTLSKILVNGKSLLSSKDLIPKGILTANVEIVRNEFMNKYPELVTGYLRVLNKTAREMKANPEKCVPELASFMHISEDEVRKIMAGSVKLDADDVIAKSCLGTTDDSGTFVQNIIDTADFLYKQKSLAQKPNVDVLKNFVRADFATKVATENNRNK